jgi:Lrp/AsnC family transcriptional regulator for asnA, asnC and gidA
LELDEVDYQILEFLRKDARTPFTEVGKNLGVSDATIHVRVKKMIDEGIIHKFTVEVNDEALGNITGLVLINVDPGYLEEVATKVVESEKVSEIYEVHGSTDLIAKITADDLTDIRSTILDIRDTPNITTSEMLTIFKKWK